MKKRLALFLAALLLVLLTACQNEQARIFEETSAGESSEVHSAEGPQSTASSETTEPQSADSASSHKPYIIQPMPNSGAGAPLTPLPGENLSGELTIKMFYWRGDPPNIYWLGQEFMQRHPNVRISFEYELNGSDIQNATVDELERRREAFYARMRPELLSGEADYILYRNGEYLNVNQLSRSGVLTDLLPYWENDPDIAEKDYFMDVLKTFKVDGKLPSIPASFLFAGAFLNRPLMEELGVNLDERFAVTGGDILGWYEQARETNPELQLLFGAPGKDTLFPFEKPSFIDLQDKTASFDTPEFIRFLERSNAVIDDDPALDPVRKSALSYAAMANERIHAEITGKPLTITPAEYAPDVIYDMATKSRLSFATAEVMSMYELANFQQPLEHMAGPFPLISSDGHIGLTSSEDFALPASCKNPELAWEFIKYCISEREALTFAHYGDELNYFTKDIPLNKKNFSLLTKNIPEMVKMLFSPGYTAFEPLDEAGLTEILERAFALNPVNMNQYGINVQEYLDEYYVSGLTTAKQCAEKIQGRAELWLGE